MGNQKSKLSKAEVKALSKSTEFSPEALNDLYAEFKKLDTDGSGELDRTEFRQLWKSKFKIRNASVSQIDAYFDAFDTDGSGTVDFKEFATALSVLGPGTKEAKLEYLFNVYDTDKSGDLSTDELETMLQQMMAVAVVLDRCGEKDKTFIKGMIASLDVDKDGSVTRQEWIERGSRMPSLLLFLGITDNI